MLERLLCAVLGHRYVVERVLNQGARKVGCTRCGRHWAMHDETRSFVEWDGEFEAFYAPGGIMEEREKCAKVCESADKSTHPSDIAEAIRARKEDV